MNARHDGFSLIEILVAVAILAVLGAIAVVGYGQYTTRAGAADLVSRHHDIRTAVIANAATRGSDNCADLVKGYDGSKLADPFATLSYGFEAVAGGYRPVLAVCATAAQSGGVAVARRAHETFANQGLVEKNPVLTDTLVSFALRLTPADQALCKTAPGIAPSACGGGALVLPPQAAVTQPPAATQPPGTAAQPPAAQPVRPPTVQSLTQAVAQIPAAQIPARSPAQQAAVTAAVQNLIQGLSQATSADDALARTIAAAQALPSEVLTQSVPANTPQAKATLARCPAIRLGQTACKDNMIDDSCTKDPTFAGHFDQCVPAMMCPKTAGLCQGVTPEMRALLDASWQRMPRQ